MICMTLPGMSEFSDINFLFIQVISKRPDMFFDDVHIESVYGGFSGSRLCGGRNNTGLAVPLNSIRCRISRYNELGIGCNVTFSNQLATASMLEKSSYDYEILNILNEGEGNGVIVYSDMLAKAIRNEFPHVRLIASTTKSLRRVDQIEKAYELYDRVVLDYNTTKDKNFIDGIHDRKRLEVMVNEYCTLGCPFRNDHYLAISKAQLQGKQAEFACRHKDAPQADGFLQGLISGNVFLINEEIRAYHDSFGIESFKIVGRGLSRYDVIDSYLYYLAKGGAWYELRDFLIHHNFI